MIGLGYHLRRILLEWRLHRTEEAARYCRATRAAAEQGVAHHDDEARRLRLELVYLEHRADLARLGGGS